MGPNDPAQSGTAWLMSVIARGAPWGWTDSFDGRAIPEVSGLLLGRLRPRAAYGQQGAPYVDQEGALRDPYVDFLVNEPQGQRRLGGQLNYNKLDSETVLH